MLINLINKMELKKKLKIIFSKLLNKDEKDNKCCICLVEYDNNIAILNCGHTFHYLCITSWNERGKKCPICRREIIIKEHIVKQKNINILQILLIISALVLLFSLFSWTRTSLCLKEVCKKIYTISKELIWSIFYIIKTLLYELMLKAIIKELFLMIFKIGKNFGYVVFTIIKIIYYLFKLVAVILLSALMLLVNVIIDCMNILVFIDEKLFKML